MNPVEAPGAVLAKGAFAALIGVTPGRVSQMIREGLIGPNALVGEGRSARVRVDLARRQIAARRHAGQASGNGQSTRLNIPVEVAAGLSLDDVPTLTTEVSSVEDRIKQERLFGAKITNRKAEEAEESRRGRYVEADAVADQRRRVVAAIVETFEAALPQIARALAQRFALPEDEVLAVLTAEFKRMNPRTE